MHSIYYISHWWNDAGATPISTTGTTFRPLRRKYLTRNWACFFAVVSATITNDPMAVLIAKTRSIKV